MTIIPFPSPRNHGEEIANARAAEEEARRLELVARIHNRAIVIGCCGPEPLIVEGHDKQAEKRG